MKLLRGFKNIQVPSNGIALTIGSFDGIHRGHQALIKQLIRRAEEQNLPSGLLTFEPLPKEYFIHDDAPARLNSLREKLTMFKKFGLNYVSCIKFNET